MADDFSDLGQLIDNVLVLDEDLTECEHVEDKPLANSKLNKEGTRILEQLPDLSYMLAKTLVFPRRPKY